MRKEDFEKIKKASLASLRRPGRTVRRLPKEESKKYPEIYLFRHGESYDNQKRLFSGWRDSRLTSKGIKQAKILKKILKGKDIDLCIVSRLSRSQQTAKIVLADHPDVKYEVDNRIIERNYGILQGESKLKLARKNLELFVKYHRGYNFPASKGESIKMVEKRVLPFCKELVDRVKKHNINVAISAHGNSMRAIRKYFEKLSVIEELTIENPLGKDYAEYVIKSPRWASSSSNKRLYFATLSPLTGAPNLTKSA